MTTNYKGFLIEEVWCYTDGKSDFHVFEEDADTGWLEHRRTLEGIKADIDEKIDEMFTDEFGCIDHSALNIANNHWKTLALIANNKIQTP